MAAVFLISTVAFYIINQPVADRFFGIAGNDSEKVKEKKFPLQFLNIEHEVSINGIGLTEVKGKIYNKAHHISYTDIGYTLTFFSRSGKYLGKSDFLITEKVKPAGFIFYKVYPEYPEGTASIIVKLKQAKTAE